MVTVECSVCGKKVPREECRGISVETRGVQYVCAICRRRLSFDEVMDALASGKVYDRGGQSE